jgi:hypothetical protein
MMTDSRRSEPDAEQKYVRKNVDRMITGTAIAMLPSILLEEYILGIGNTKSGDRPKPRLYSDVIMVSKHGE